MTLLQFLHENSEIHSHLSSRIRVGILGKVHITSPFCYFVCCRLLPEGLLFIRCKAQKCHETQCSKNGKNSTDKGPIIYKMCICIHHIWLPLLFFFILKKISKNVESKLHFFFGFQPAAFVK